MGIVNVNTSELFQILNNVRIAIASIEKSKQSINKKYQRLNSNWKDKKYVELENIIHECNQSFDDILRILFKSERFLNLLVKNLQDYADVNLGDAFIENLRNIKYSTKEEGLYQSYLGISTKGTFPKPYIDSITERYGNAETKVRQVFDYFTSYIIIQDANYPPNITAHYSPVNHIEHHRGIYYNAISDMTNPKGVGTTYFHEIAHMIDHASMNYQRNISNIPDFKNALMNDGQRILQMYNRWSLEEQNAFLIRIRTGPTHSVADLIDAITDGQLQGGYVHSREYWNRPGNLQAEAFAHFFEASMGCDNKLKMLASFFPSAFAVFLRLIDTIQTIHMFRQ